MGQVRMTIESSNKRASCILGLVARTSVMTGGQVKESGMNLYHIGYGARRMDSMMHRGGDSEQCATDVPRNSRHLVGPECGHIGVYVLGCRCIV